jgi:hypothetical protein
MSTVCNILLVSAEDVLKKKWRYLRDYFSDLMNERLASGSGAESIPPSWPHYQSLTFLKENITKREMKSSLEPGNENADVGVTSSEMPPSNSEVRSAETAPRRITGNVIIHPAPSSSGGTLSTFEGTVLLRRLLSCASSYGGFCQY